MRQRISDLTGANWSLLPWERQYILRGGWVAESYLAYACLLTVLYNQVSSIIQDLVIDKRPFQCFIQSAYVCVCHVMTMQNVNTSTTDNYIKIFLSCCDSFTKEPNKNPWWVCGNILSILNLKDQIDMYGSLCLYWEGNREHYIQMVKPLMQNMRTSITYFQQILKELHTSVAFREMLTKASLPGQWNTSQEYHRLKLVVIYDPRNEVIQFLVQKHPVSGMVTFNDDCCDNTYICFTTRCHNIGLNNVNWTDNGTDVYGLWYDTISISDKSAVVFRKDNLEDIYSYKDDFVLVLPQIQTTSDNHTYHCAITSNWLVHTVRENVNYPTLILIILKCIVNKFIKIINS